MSTVGTHRVEPASWLRPALLLLLLAGLLLPAPPAAAGPLELEVHKAKVLRFEREAATVFVADPEIADIKEHSGSVIYVFGRRAGTTTLFAIDSQDQIVAHREIRVGHNVSGLERVLERVFPDQDIAVESIDGGLLLGGDLRSPSQAEELRQIATPYLGENEVLINRTRVSAPTQVNLRVQIAEVSRLVTKRLGVNWQAFATPTDFVFGLIFGRDFVIDTGVDDPFIELPADDAGAFEFQNVAGDRNIHTFLEALERDGLVSILAEPNLTAISGETASFLAGGEFPVVVGTDDNNDLKIEFKEYGVKLAFTPTVLNEGRISMRVRPEVSSLTDTGAVTLNNITIPALSTRRAETTVEMASGQSFAIGGLITNDLNNNLDKFPGLGDIPVVGALFRSTDFQRSESELVIIVTPYTVEPVRTASLKRPTDGMRVASDLERILEGRLVGTTASPAGARPRIAGGQRLFGDVGFILE